MDLQGNCIVNAPRPVILLALNDPEKIRALLPEITTIKANANSGFDLKLSRKVGPLAVRLSGTWATEAAGDKTRVLIGLAGPFGAKVAVSLDISVEDVGAGICRLSHEGRAEFGGLVRRIVEEWAAMAQHALDARIHLFGRRVAAGQSAARA